MNGYQKTQAKKLNLRIYDPKEERVTEQPKSMLHKIRLECLRAINGSRNMKGRP